MAHDMSKYASSDSKDLKAADFRGKNLKVFIKNVSTRTYPARDDQSEQTKPVLEFEGKEKVLVLNAGNTRILCEAYGPMDSDWLGHEVGLSTKDYEGFGTGWVIQPLDVEGPEFSDEIPF